MYTQLCKHVPCYSHTKYKKKKRNENHPYLGSKVEENHKLLCDLFDDDFYFLSVMSIFATFKLGGVPSS